MKIPRSVPYFKHAVIAAGLYAAVWMILEGDIWRDILLAASSLAVGAAAVVTRRWGGRTLPAGKGVFLAPAVGLCWGAAVALLTLFLMALKTGLHAHGPEYTTAETVWVLGQLPVWGGAGALAGLGLGLLLVARGRR